MFDTEKKYQWEWTFVYEYDDDPNEDGVVKRIRSYHCSHYAIYDLSHDVANEIWEEKGIENEVEERNAKIIREIPNDFNMDDILSDHVIFYLNNSFTSLFSNGGEDYTNYCEICNDCLLYIQSIYISLRCSDEQNHYKNLVLKAIHDKLEYKPSKTNTDVLKQLLNIFNITIDFQRGIKGQLLKLAKEKEYNEQLLVLTDSHHCKYLERKLIEMDNIFHFDKLKSKYEISVAFFWFGEFYPHFRKNFTFEELTIHLSTYYNIEKPTYRKNVVKKYKPRGCAQTLCSSTKEKYKDFWYSMVN